MLDFVCGVDIAPHGLGMISVFTNRNATSPLASVEFDDASRTAFFAVTHELDITKARETLANAGQAVITQTAVNGRTIFITHGADERDEMFKKIAAAGGGDFSPKPPEKTTFLKFLRTNGWKIRGGSSVIGQSMTLFSAAKSVSKVDADAGRLTPKFDPAMGGFAVLNLAANFINYVFGGQKEKDTFGLQKFDGIIADEVNRLTPEGAKKISPEDVRKISYMTDAERGEYDKQNGGALNTLKRNSVRLGEVGLRTLGSVCMVVDYQKIFKSEKRLEALKLWKAGGIKNKLLAFRTNDRNTFLAGCGMVAGKIMGLLATTYDPNNPPKTYWQEIRQKVLWITSSFTEMIAQSSVAIDRHKNKRLVLGEEANKKAYYDYAGVVGNVLLTVPPYPTRLVLPYGEKVLDVDEVQARLLDELPRLPKDKIPEVAARVTARMVEHMGEKSPGFGKLYSDIIRKLDKFDHIDVFAQQPETAPKPVVFREKLAPQAAVKSDKIREILAHSAAETPSQGLQIG
jgi:hypothetical protein